MTSFVFAMHFGMRPDLGHDRKLAYGTHEASHGLMLLLLPPPAKGAPFIDKSLRQQNAPKRPDLFDNIAQAEFNAPVVFIVVCLAVAVAVALIGVHWWLPVRPLAIARPATSKHAQAKAPSTTFGKSRPLRVQAYTPVADASIAICLRVVAPPCKDASANRTNQTKHIRFAKKQKNGHCLVNSVLHIACRLSLRDVQVGGGNLHIPCGQCA